MRIGRIALALLALNWDAAAVDLTVYVTSDGPAVTSSSKMIASSIFRKAGVAIDWRRQPPPVTGAPRKSLRIELAAQTPEERLPGALAVSYPFARCSKSITVFLDRVRLRANGVDRESVLLAYVLVHEITHVIQGVDRHSEAGVMKAHWSAEDRAAIFGMRLGFVEQDLLLMQRGLAADWCRDPATLTRLSE